jgi:hypothetical protein
MMASAAVAWSLIRYVPHVIDVEAVRVPQQLVQIIVPDESALTGTLGLRTGLVPIAPAELGFQK